jgi:hypothetical protein
MLHCRHCRGRYLKGMTTVAPPALLDHAMALANHGAHGFLVSGGCDRRGRLLHLDEALDGLAAVRRRTNLVVAVHAGVVDDDVASRLLDACDVAFADVVGSDETAKQVIGLDSATPYRRSLQRLVDAGVPVTPHVTLGLHHGQIVGEHAAIDVIAALPVEKMVVNVICPTPATAFASMSPPPLPEIASLFEYAVERCGRVALGCMRPRGRPDIERAAVAAGIRDIVLPSRATRGMLASDDVVVERLPVCCGIPDGLVERSKNYI